MKLKYMICLLCLLMVEKISYGRTDQPLVVTKLSQNSFDFGKCTVGGLVGGAYLLVNFNGDGHANFSVSGPFLITTERNGSYLSSSLSLDVLGGAEIYIWFKPTGAGSASGAITISTSGGNWSVSLKGTGVPLATLNAPSSVDFGSVTIGTQAVKFFTLSGTNLTGDTRMDITGPFGASGTLTAAQVSAGTEVEVDFNPGSAGSVNGTITLTTPGGSMESGVPDVVKTISITGTGILAPTAPTDSSAIGGDNDKQAAVAEPIQLGTGSYEYSHSDLRLTAINGRFNFARYYNTVNNVVDGPMGFGWSHSFNYSLKVQTDPSSGQDMKWNVRYPDGHLGSFVPTGNGGSYPLYIGTTDSLQKNAAGDFTLLTTDNNRYHFTAAGIMDKVTDLNGNTTTLTYSGGNLVSVVAPGGRKYTIAYSGTKVTSVTDPLSRVCSYTYDASGNLQTVKDANSGITTFTYDANHRMLKVVNALGNTLVDNTYDSNGKVIRQLDAYSQSTAIAYNTPSTGDATVTNPDNSQMIAHHDDSFRKTYIRDEMGRDKYYTYDSFGNENDFVNEESQEDSRTFDKKGNMLSRTLGGNTVNYVYNAFNSPIKITDANGNTTNFTYDTNNNLITVQSADNITQTFGYNTAGLRTSWKDGRVNTTTYAYSAAGDLLSVTAPNGVKTFQYDLAGRVTTETDENGNTIKTTYDNNDNILTTTDALNHKTTFTYNANDKLLTVTDKSGFKTTFVYDKKDRLLSKTDPNGGITKYAYDVRDNMTSITAPNNTVINYGYDKKNRKISSINSLGTTQYQYDGVGNILKLIDATNKTTTYTYTLTNKLKSVEDNLANITSYTYDKNDNPLTVTDPQYHTTTYTYDALNRLVTILDANNNTTRITYDGNGNKKTVADAKGHVQTNTYDAANLLTAALDAAGNTTSYKYDGAGNITLITKPTGTITKVYDAVNRLTGVTNSTGENYAFIYDNNNNITSMTSGAGNTVMAYDKLNRLTQYTDPFSKKIIYSYDAAGNKKSITYPNNKTVNYTYDQANNLSTVADWMSHTFTYAYDGAGRTIKLSYPNGIHCDYAYDGAGKLISQQNLTAANVVLNGSTFVLDGVGNRLTENKQGAIPSNLKPASKAYTYGNDDRMLKDSIWTFVNDNTGNRTSETNGKVKATYSFSVDGRLAGMLDTLGTTQSFSYDAVGNRLTKTKGNNVNRYVVDINNNLSQVLQITDAFGVIRSQYVHGQELLERVDSTGNVFYYLYDAQHNIAAMADAVGNLTDTYVYDPFGALLTHTGTTNQPFTFLGQYGVEQESSSLYYARARYYDAANGRFLSKDPYPFALDNPQTVNRYVYAINDPLLRYDPTGLLSNEDDAHLSGTPTEKPCESKDVKDDIIGAEGLVYSLGSDGLRNDWYWMQKNGAFRLVSEIESNFLYERSYDLAGARTGIAGTLSDGFSVLGVINAGYNLLNDRSYAHLFELGVAGLAFVPGVGWVIAGGYFIADYGFKHYTKSGHSIAERIVGDGYIPHLMY